MKNEAATAEAREARAGIDRAMARPDLVEQVRAILPDS
jgi:hypothetical protein